MILSLVKTFDSGHCINIGIVITFYLITSVCHKLLADVTLKDIQSSNPTLSAEIVTEIIRECSVGQVPKY